MIVRLQPDARARQLVLGALLALFGSASASAQLFSGEQVSVGEDPVALDGGDLDGDGEPDLVVLHQSSAALRVYLSATQPSFAFASQHGGAAEWSGHVRLTDLDADGELDVVAGDHTGLETYLGDGSGALAPTASQLLGFTRRAAALTDVDADGLPDLARADAPSAGVFWHPGSGTGAFGPGISVAALGPIDVLAAGDLSGDGRADLVLVGGGTLSALLGDGQGSFALAGMAPSALYPIDLTLEDVDRDGHTDVLAGSTFGSGTLLGDGTGALAPAASTGSAPYASGRLLAAGDTSADGVPDLVAAHMAEFGGGQWSNALFVSHGDGSGGTAGWTSIYQPDRAVGAVLLDANADGAQDLVVLRDGQAGVASLYDGDRVEGVLGLETQSTAPNQSPSHPRLADFDLDGRLDLCARVHAGIYGGALALRPGEGLASFGKAVVLASPGGNLADYVAGDLDADGELDLVTCLGTKVHVMLGASGLRFMPALSYDLAMSLRSLELADFDLDGFLDVVASEWWTSAPASESRVCFVPGSGTGAFGPAISAKSGVKAMGFAVGDLTADGLPDIAAVGIPVSPVAQSFRLVPGVAGGGLGTPFSIGLGFQAQSVGMGDLDADGVADAVASGWTTGASPHLPKLARIPGGSAGALASAQTLDGALYVEHLLDLDRDGWLDVGGLAGAGVGVALGDGSGALGAVQAFSAAYAANGVAVGDLDADGLPDMLATSYKAATKFGGIANELTVHENLSGAGPPKGVVPFGTGTPGCRGTIALAANLKPELGQGAFALTCTNAPPLADGFGLIGAVQDVSGSDPLGLGALLHVALSPSAPVVYPLRSDAGGAARGHLPIPAAPALAGKTAYAQAVWREPAWQSCGQSVLGFVSSRGLVVTVLP